MTCYEAKIGYNMHVINYSPLVLKGYGQITRRAKTGNDRGGNATGCRAGAEAGYDPGYVVLYSCCIESVIFLNDRK